MIKRKEHKKPYWWWKQRKPSKAIPNDKLMAVLRQEMQKLRAYGIDTHKGDEV